MTTQDTIDVARAVAMARYMEALKNGNETERKAALADATRIHHEKIERQLANATPAAPHDLLSKSSE